MCKGREDRHVCPCAGADADGDANVRTHALDFRTETTQRRKLLIPPGHVVRFFRLACFDRFIRLASACLKRRTKSAMQRETPEGADGRDGGCGDHERGCARERECYLTCVTVALDAASRPRMEGRQASAVCMDVPAHGRGRVGAPVAFEAEIWRACWRLSVD